MNDEATPQSTSTMVDADNDVLCKSTLIAFVSCRNGEDCEHDHEFTQQELAAATAGDVTAWFNFKACGTPTPAGDDHPVEG